MTNQSPAEGLRQQIETKVSKWFGEPVLAVEDEIMELVTAYAATVEREAVEQFLALPSMQHEVRDREAYRKGKQTDTKRGIKNTLRNKIRAELAALQGPPDEAEGKA